jgi:hypothetical protein
MNRKICQIYDKEGLKMLFNTQSIFTNCDQMPHAYEANRDAIRGIFAEHTDSRMRDYCTTSIQQLMAMLKNLDHLFINMGHVAYANNDVEYYTPTGPNQFPSGVSEFTTEDTDNWLQFIEIQRSASILNKVDAYNKDERAISLMLQENIHHKVRVYKNESGNQILVISNKITSTLVRRVIALMPKLWPKREYNPCIDTPEYAKILEFFTKDNATEEEYTAWDTITSAWINASPAIEQYQLKIFADALNSRVRNRMVVVQRNYDTYQAQYTSYMNNLSSCIKNMEQAANELIGLRTNTAIFGKEILDYIKTIKPSKPIRLPKMA